MFIAGSNKTKFESYGEKLADDYAGDQAWRHPKTVEDALAVMQAYLDNHQKDVKTGANFNQVDLSKIQCFKCEKMELLQGCQSRRSKTQVANLSSTKMLRSNMNSDLSK